MSNRENYISRLEKQLTELTLNHHECSGTKLIIERLKLISDEEYDLKYHEKEQELYKKRMIISKIN